jgi:hypothetical protein
LRQWWHICPGPLARVPQKCSHFHMPQYISPKSHKHTHVRLEICHLVAYSSLRIQIPVLGYFDRNLEHGVDSWRHKKLC